MRYVLLFCWSILKFHVWERLQLSVDLEIEIMGKYE